ncbi:propanediol utilization protein [Marinovum sp. SP66]|jgi:uncharacterized protein involved in propanediol utilization|uniref:propanediol utilization protein n=1 Tax=Marinovum TaxID=367771 RepID=UPI00237C007C|nr:propanediol utilization protein [Marinovum sp. SP66]MDD9738884.1 propanediol utilization protein [Marinovum sp. SP66]
MSGSEVSVAGHFGEWLQGRIGPEGPVALVTLPCAALRVDTPGPTPPPFSEAQLTAFARSLGLCPAGTGSRRQMPVGGGAGASTATLVALARVWGFRGPPAALAAACIAVEGASDPLMFPRPDRLLWASRAGRVLRPLAPPPPCTIVGGFFGAAERTDPDDSDFDDITDLVADWAAATGAGDLRRIAALATTSAARCTARRGPAADPTADLARAQGALGWLRAHTGAARGLIFAPGTVPAGAVQALAEAGFRQRITFPAGGA